MSDTPNLRQTPLHSRHTALGAKMIAFAGYQMPLQYGSGIITEHKHTRNASGLFDISYMGQFLLKGPDHTTTALALEALSPGDFKNLKPGRQRYSQFTNEDGGILDDLMVIRPEENQAGGDLLLIVNAARKEADFSHLRARLAQGVEVETLEERALFALQGPKTHNIIERLSPEAAALSFMSAKQCKIAGIDCHICRSGYTGEDGFEISVPNKDAGSLMDELLKQPGVEPIGLGARDSLRLEAGLCLYGHDIDETTSPIEGGLIWSISKRRRIEGGFPGEEQILREIAGDRKRILVAIRPEGRLPAREGALIMKNGVKIGTVTSGGFGPTLGGPIAMGYVPFDLRKSGTRIDLLVRGKMISARLTKLPFVAHRYRR